MTPLVALACAGAGLASGLLVAGTVLGVARWCDAHQLPLPLGGWRAIPPRPYPTDATRKPPPSR